MAKVNDIEKRKVIDYAFKDLSDTMVVKDVDMSKRIVTGLYNTYNYFDSDYDVILPGAATKSINERGPLSQSVAKIKHLLFHDWTKLPGKIKVLEEKTLTVQNRKVQGIYFETEMMETQDGIDTLINYQNEVYDNHSIGFRFLDGEWVDSEAENWDQILGTLLNPDKAEEAGFMYLWKEIKLYEGSTVAFGANDLTPFLGVKSTDKIGTQLKLQARLSTLLSQTKSGKQSDEMLQSFEMQILQIKQIIHELFSKEPSSNPTSKPGPGKKDTSMMIHCDSCGSDFDGQNMTPDNDGAYACPDCNQLCMPGSKTQPIINFQFI